jgi:heptosyltransferase-2
VGKSHKDMQPSSAKVIVVRTLEEARQAIFQAERFSCKAIALRLFLSAWVPAANLCLNALRFLLFGVGEKGGEVPLNIVVYTVGILGDNVVLLSALAALRQQYPEAVITVITNCQEWSPQGAIAVLGNSPFVNRMIVLDDHPVMRRGSRFHIDNGRLDDLRCDLFVNLSPFGNRGWLGAVVREMIFAWKLKAKRVAGFRMSTLSRNRIFNRVQHQFVINEPRRPSSVLHEIGIIAAKASDLLAQDNQAKRSICRKLEQELGSWDSLLVINPGAKFIAQRWPAERFGIVARQLVERFGMKVVVTGTASEKEIAERVVTSSHGTAISLAGNTSVQELVELLRLSKGCITNDTGTMHLAAMVGVPTVALFSVRHSPTHWLPLGRNVVSLFSLVECRFCYNDLCSDRECLKSIGVEDVVNAFVGLMNRQDTSLAGTDHAA